MLPVEIVDMPSGRLPAAVEAAAYYITAEALANSAKHSRASLVTVSICGGDTETVVEVVDNGVGGADPDAGTGLRGLADRVAALGGALAVSSAPEGAPPFVPSSRTTDSNRSARGDEARRTTREPRGTRLGHI